MLRSIFYFQKTGDTPKELLKHKEFCDMLLDMSHEPGSLQQLCRVKIRNQTCANPPTIIEGLKLPRSIKDFLLLNEFN